jgi:cardiolipin synthase A/B
MIVLTALEAVTAAVGLQVLRLPLPWWLGIPLLVYWVVVAVLLIMDNREPARTLTWLFVLLLLPILGLLLFLFFGRDWKVITARRSAREHLMESVEAKMEPIYERNKGAAERFAGEFGGTAAEDISTAIERTNGSKILPAATLEIFTAGADKFARLEQDLAAAQRFIHLEYFIWQKDELTGKITAILLDRLAAGVEVRIMYDYMGAISTKKDELERLAAAGAKVSADVTQGMKLNYRNHRKIAVIDGEIGYTGGMNMGQEYIDGGERFPMWRDTHMRLTGQAVAELQKLFAMRWLLDEHDDILRDEYLPAPDGSGDAGVLTQTVAHAVEDQWEASRRAHMIAIASARRTLRIQSPYFVPDQAMYETLINAAQRGVDLQFMMTGDKQVDKKLPFWAAQTYYRQLLEAGARIFQYEAGFFHAKTIAVDSQFGAIGTMNMDVRSLRLHKELMMWIYDEQKALEMEHTFEHDLESCREITVMDTEAVPAFTRFRNSFARLFSAQI